MDRLSKREKLYRSIKNNKKGRTYRELVSLLKKYGFEVIESQGNGSHSPVIHNKFPDLRWTLSIDKPMGVYHAKKVIELVEEVMERE